MQANQLSLWILALCYIIYFLVSCFAWKEDQLNIDGRNGLLPSLRIINCKHLAGIIVLGLPLRPEEQFSKLMKKGAALGVSIGRVA
jgi:hypothetical protein